jgi:aspartate aminotransferase
MKKLADRLSAITPSSTGVVTERALALKAAGRDVISLSVGEPDFDTPAHIVTAAKEALDAGETRYTEVFGVPRLRQQVAEVSCRDRGVPVSAEQVIITVGAKHALFNFFQTLLNPGDEVIIPAPYWVSYPEQVRLAGGVPVIARTDPKNGFSLTLEELNRLKTPRTRAVVINTPNNPTGAVYEAEGLRAVTESAVEDGIYVVSDEVYRALVYGDRSHVSPLTLAPEEMKDRVFVVDGVSKTFAMTGWRIGWGIGDEEIIAAMAKIQSQATSNPAAMAQAAAVAALAAPDDFLDGWRAAYRERRDTVVDGLSQMPGVTCDRPDGAFYVLPSVSGALRRMGPEATDINLATYLLDEAGVAVVPGDAFGAPGHIRISYAAALETLREAMARMKKAIERLGG